MDELFLIFGATSKTGSRLVKELIQNNKKVRLCVRDEIRAKEILGDDFNKVDYIYQLGQTFDEENLKRVFRDVDELNKKINVVSVLAYNGDKHDFNNVDLYRDQFYINSLLVKISSEDKFVNKFIFVSSLYVNRENFIFSKFVESIRPKALFYKSLLEFMIKQSGMNYLIFRPGKLESDKLDGPMNVNISQGDKITGLVTYNTLAYIMTQIILGNKSQMTVDIAAPPEYMAIPIDSSYINKQIAELKQDALYEGDPKQSFLVRNFQGNSHTFNGKGLATKIIAVGIIFKLAAKILRKKYTL
jgi:hypothetical protein